MSKSLVEDLRLILEESEFLTSLIIQKITWQEFRNDAILLRAVTRSIDVMGAIISQMNSADLKELNQINWEKLTQQREEVNRDYRLIDYEQIWAFIHQEAAELYAQVEKALKEQVKS
ncbi:MAG: HepT-like ribonuclease domain-containing protein [Bacteroidota bacterium]